jgi:hypothetical protein
MDGEMHPRRQLPLLERALVDGVRDEVGADAAVVEQGVPLGRRASPRT